MVDINLFFSPLRNFKIEKTGNAVIADDKAYLVYDRRVEPFTNKFCEYDELKKILQDENRWGMLSSAYAYNGKTLVAYSKINLPISEVKGIQWYVFVEQDLKEVLSPLDRLMLQMVIIGMILLIILALLVFILNGEGTPSYSLLQVFKESAPAKVEKTEEKEPSEMRSDDSRLPGGED
ncbi:MAG: hypothetical protein NT079_04885 [Candidatus Omnitrophica bacterium]|nr:hypothetical protein [Candidatus Omnitrophota bacterium]